MNLQLFAERTEEESPRRLEKARKEGRFPRSADLMTGLTLVVGATALRSFGPSLYQEMTGGMAGTLSGLNRSDLTPDLLSAVMHGWVLVFLRTLVPVAALIIIATAAAGLLQGRFHLSLSHLAPDFTRIDPLTGLGRIFSRQTLAEFAHMLLKVSLVGWIAYREVTAALPEISTLAGENVARGTALIADRAVGGLRTIGMGLLALGVLEYGYRYWELRQSMKMTKQEVKQETKESDNPEIKQRQRQRQREMARRRKALKDLPTADVVITNPTHLAVAIRYRPDEDASPRVLAKGSEMLAQRMKVIAGQHRVPVVENKPLARTLFATVEVGRTVPPELYHAVAEVLAFVCELRRQDRRERPVSQAVR